MQNAGHQYGPGAASAHQPQQFVPSEPSPNGGSTTSSLRQFRKKDVDKSQTEPQKQMSESHVARVAPHNHYPPVSSNCYRYPSHQFQDYSPQAKYSDITEIPQPNPISTSVIQKPKPKDFMEMCNVQQPHMKQAYPDHLNSHQNYSPENGQYIHKDSTQVNTTGYKPESHFFPKDHNQYQQLSHHAVQKFNPMLPQNMRKYTPAENPFLTKLSKIHPSMARSIMSDHHLQDSQPSYPTMDQRGMYQQNQRFYPGTLQPNHYAPNSYSVNSPHHFPNYPPASCSYSRPAQVGSMGPRYPHMERSISPARRPYPDHMHMSPMNYHSMSQKLPSHNYPHQYNSPEYAQHYQHRRMSHDFYQQHCRPTQYLQNHQMPAQEMQEIPESRVSPSDSLKKFIENWDADEEPTNEINAIENNINIKENIRVRDDPPSGTVYMINASDVQYFENGIPLVTSDNGGISLTPENYQYLIKNGLVDNSGMVRIIEANKDVSVEPNSNHERVVNLQIMDKPDCMMANKNIRTNDMNIMRNDLPNTNEENRRVVIHQNTIINPGNNANKETIKEGSPSALHGMEQASLHQKAVGNINVTKELVDKNCSPINLDQLEHNLFNDLDHNGPTTMQTTDVDISNHIPSCEAEENITEGELSQQFEDNQNKSPGSSKSMPIIDTFNVASTEAKCHVEEETDRSMDIESSTKDVDKNSTKIDSSQLFNVDDNSMESRNCDLTNNIKEKEVMIDPKKEEIFESSSEIKLEDTHTNNSTTNNSDDLAHILKQESVSSCEFDSDRKEKIASSVVQEKRCVTVVSETAEKNINEGYSVNQQYVVKPEADVMQVNNTKQEDVNNQESIVKRKDAVTVENIAFNEIDKEAGEPHLENSLKEKQLEIRDAGTSVNQSQQSFISQQPTSEHISIEGKNAANNLSVSVACVTPTPVERRKRIFSVDDIIHHIGNNMNKRNSKDFDTVCISETQKIFLENEVEFSSLEQILVINQRPLKKKNNIHSKQENESKAGIDKIILGHTEASGIETTMDGLADAKCGSVIETQENQKDIFEANKQSEEKKNEQLQKDEVNELLQPKKSKPLEEGPQSENDVANIAESENTDTEKTETPEDHRLVTTPSPKIGELEGRPITPSEVQYRSAIRVEENSVLLQIAGELMEINVNLVNGKKVINVVPLSDSTIVDYNDNYDLFDNIENANTGSENESGLQEDTMNTDEKDEDKADVGTKNVKKTMAMDSTEDNLVKASKEEENSGKIVSETFILTGKCRGESEKAKKCFNCTEENGSDNETVLDTLAKTEESKILNGKLDTAENRTAECSVLLEKMFKHTEPMNKIEGLTNEKVEANTEVLKYAEVNSNTELFEYPLEEVLIPVESTNEVILSDPLEGLELVEEIGRTSDNLDIPLVEPVTTTKEINLENNVNNNGAIKETVHEEGSSEKEQHVHLEMKAGCVSVQNTESHSVVNSQTSSVESVEINKLSSFDKNSKKKFYNQNNDSSRENENLTIKREKINPKLLVQIPQTKAILYKPDVLILSPTSTNAEDQSSRSEAKVYLEPKSKNVTENNIAESGFLTISTKAAKKLYECDLQIPAVTTSGDVSRKASKTPVKHQNDTVSSSKRENEPKESSKNNKASPKRSKRINEKALVKSEQKKLKKLAEKRKQKREPKQYDKVKKEEENVARQEKVQEKTKTNDKKLTEVDDEYVDFKELLKARKLRKLKKMQELREKEVKLKEREAKGKEKEDKATYKETKQEEGNTAEIESKLKEKEDVATAKGAKEKGASMEEKETVVNNYERAAIKETNELANLAKIIKVGEVTSSHVREKNLESINNCCIDCNKGIKRLKGEQDQLYSKKLKSFSEEMPSVRNEDNFKSSKGADSKELATSVVEKQVAESVVQTETESLIQGRQKLKKSVSFSDEMPTSTSSCTVPSERVVEDFNKFNKPSGKSETNIITIKDPRRKSKGFAGQIIVPSVSELIEENAVASPKKKISLADYNNRKRKFSNDSSSKSEAIVAYKLEENNEKMLKLDLPVSDNNDSVEVFSDSKSNESSSKKNISEPKTSFFIHSSDWEETQSPKQSVNKQSKEECLTQNFSGLITNSKKPVIDITELNPPLQNLKDSKLQEYKDKVDSKLSSLNIQIPKAKSQIVDNRSKISLGPYGSPETSNLVKRFLNNEKMSQNEMEKIKKIISYKRWIQHQKNAVSPEFRKSPSNSACRQSPANPTYEIKNSIRPEADSKEMKLHLKKVCVRRKSQPDTEEEDSSSVCSERSEINSRLKTNMDYSVYNKLGKDGLPKIILKRNRESFQCGDSDAPKPVVLLERLELDRVEEKYKVTVNGMM